MPVERRRDNRYSSLYAYLGAAVLRGIRRVAHFLSHSSANNAEAAALRDWLESEGWKDEIFLDLDPKRGIAAGERWERKLNEAANRCEVVLFLVSKAWIASVWCRRELGLAHHLNKQLFGVLIEDLSVAEVPKDITADWQLVRLATGRDHVVLRTVLPVTHEEVHVTFSEEGLQRLKHGLEQAGLDPKHFAWPPANDPTRPPYRGLRPLEAEDTGIFFGRDAPVIEVLDRLRGLRGVVPPRLLVILGASGAGKSSFLRAGLLPRLKRDDRHYLPLARAVSFVRSKVRLRWPGSRCRVPICERPSKVVPQCSSRSCKRLLTKQCRRLWIVVANPVRLR
jgi:hypothetical protein